MPYKDRTKYLAAQRSYYHKDKEAYKWRNIKNTYDLSKEEFLDLLINQDNKCKLCDVVFDSITPRRLHIDHCHETGKVRGLLCHTCNTGLGMLGDSVESISKALEYVKGEL